MVRAEIKKLHSQLGEDTEQQEKEISNSITKDDDSSNSKNVDPNNGISIYRPESASSTNKEQPVTASSDNIVVIETNSAEAVSSEYVEVEILPPLVREDINTISTFLSKLHQVKSIELIELIDTSLFKIQLAKPINLLTILRILPEVYKAEEIIQNGRKKIVIALAAKLNRVTSKTLK